jgi:hypothetical protein
MSDEVKCRIKIKRRIRDNALRGKVQIVSQNVLLIQQAYIEVTFVVSISNI